jgi:hypothetical protein
MTTDHANIQLARLAAANDSVELDAMGYAATVTDACRAYRALAADRGAVLRHEAELVRMTRDGLPGAIIYAALLLREAGHDIAPLLAAHANDRRPLTVYPGGCQGITHWLCEAVRWAVNGELWSHPERLLAYKVEALEKAKWLELPSAEVLRVVAEGQVRERGLLVVGKWTLSFIDLLVSPHLAAMRPQLDVLLGHANLVARIYAALLIRKLDRPAGDHALATIAPSRATVERLSPTPLDPGRTVRIPIAVAVADLTNWPARS